MAEELQKTKTDLMSLKGTTLKVYRHLFKVGKALKVSDIQRDLQLSSSSVALYHIRKLLQLGLIRETQEGYVVDKVIFDNIIRFRRISIPYYAAYAVFLSTSVLLLLTVFRPAAITSTYFFALIVIIVSLGIMIYETFKSLKRLY